MIGGEFVHMAYNITKEKYTHYRPTIVGVAMDRDIHGYIHGSMCGYQTYM